MEKAITRPPVLALVSGGVGNRAADPVELYLLSLAPSSRRTMRQSLDVVANAASAGATSATLDWSSFTYATVSRVRAALAEHYAPASANKCLAALRGVLRQAMLTDQMSASEFAKCCAVKAVRGSATSAGRSISTRDITALLTSCDSESAMGRRDAAMIALLYGCGLRRSEVVAIDIGDYDCSARSLKVLGKGQKSRTAFLNTGAVAALESWLDARGRELGPLFTRVTQDGRVTGTRLSSQAVYRLAGRTSKRANVERPSPHDFRRTFVTDLLERGADLAIVQRLVGHASPATTARYDHRGDAAQRRAVELLCLPKSLTAA